MLALASPALATPWHDCPPAESTPLPGFGAAEPDPPRESRGLIVRDGPVLRLRHAGGIAEFRDGDCESAHAGPDTCFAYRHVGHFAALPGFLLQHWLWEGDRWLWLDARDGRVREFIAQPRLSPDGRLLAVVSAAEAHNDNAIEIWSRDPLARLWRHVPAGYGLYRFLGWEGEAALRLCVTMRQGDALATQPVRLERAGEGWRLTGRDAPPP